jgi:hypothetical protein
MIQRVGPMRKTPFVLGLFAAFRGVPANAAEPPRATTNAGAEAVATDCAPPSAAPERTGSGDPPPAQAPPASAASDDAPTDCVIGVAVWCFSRTSRAPALPVTKWRVEGNFGYKFSNIYYGHEIRGCSAAGCTLDFTGPSFALGAFYNVKGNPHTDDYTDIGLAVSYMPIISEIANNASGFAREYGRVDPGDGALAYIPLRIAVRRPTFLYVINSKYLVSEFGAGIAFPVASGAGQSFTGADGVKTTVGGRLGVELPVAGVARVGLAGNWTVVWYGDWLDASFQTSYGLHLGYLL